MNRHWPSLAACSTSWAAAVLQARQPEQPSWHRGGLDRAPTRSWPCGDATSRPWDVNALLPCWNPPRSTATTMPSHPRISRCMARLRLGDVTRQCRAMPAARRWRPLREVMAVVPAQAPVAAGATAPPPRRWPGQPRLRAVLDGLAGERHCSTNRAQLHFALGPR